MASERPKRTERWLHVAQMGALSAVVLVATLAVWGWWTDAAGWVRCETEVTEQGHREPAGASDTSNDASYGEVVWTTIPPGPRCQWTEARNGFDATGPSDWRWSFLLALVGASVVVACAAAARHLWLTMSWRTPDAAMLGSGSAPPS